MIYSIIEVTTKNGRVFRVALENQNQVNRFNQIVSDNKNKNGYELIVNVKVVLNGIHTIGEFEKLAEELL